jgi:hypothetical protein
MLHICTASGKGCNLYEEKIPIDPTTYNTAREFNLDPTVCALNGGEDYESLFTIDLKDFDKIKGNPNFTVIGHMTEQAQGCNLITKSGALYPLTAQGWNALQEPEKEEEKPTMSSETPELKKIQPKEVKPEEVKASPKKEEAPKEKTPEKKENIKSEGSSPEKSGSTNTPKESSGGKSESIGVTDLDEIKSLLGKMVSLLEGPLSIETMESPFRPDSRRF